MNNPNNDGLFEQVLQAQETQREGWMPEIKQGELVARLERICCDQEEEIDRLKKELGEADGKITSLSNALDDAISLIDRCSIDETPGDFSSTYYAINEVLKAHTTQNSQRQ